MRRREFLGAACLVTVPRAGLAAARSAEADAVTDGWVSDNAFAGVIAMARRGRIRHARAFGLADIEARRPATLDTRFAIGSVSKWFSTLAVLRLVDRGVVALDAPLGRHLPMLAAPAATEVRVVDLLANRSGIRDRLTEAVRRDAALRTTTASAAELAAQFANGPMQEPAGTRFDYAVLNWVLVRALLEQVAHMPFAAVVRRDVLAPLGLAHTDIAEQGFAGVPGLAPAYGRVDPPLRKADPVGAAMAASGTFVSTASDLLRAAHGVFAPGFLSRGSLARLTEVRTAEAEYALGGRVHAIDGVAWAWEQGKIGGYRTHLAHDPARDRGIVVLGNTDLPQDAIAQLVEQLAALA